MRVRAFLGLLVMTSSLARAQSQPETHSLIEASGLAGWVAQTRSTCVRNDAGTLIVGECAGWLHTDHTIFGDFTITFEVRVEGAGTEGFFGLLGVEGRDRRTEVMVALPIAGGAAAPRRSPIVVEPVALSASARARAMRPVGEWNAYAVTRNSTGVHVLLNGLEIANTGVIRASDGWIGFRADPGELEVRNLRLRYVFPTHARTTGADAGELVDGAYRPGNGVTLPKLLKEVKPEYTSDAMRHLIEGTVLLECIVGTNGRISAATVIRSLDPEYGLDAKAFEAARQWRFQAGTRDGAAVPVWITIELTFRLKK